jgi:hypothetical protein
MQEAVLKTDGLNDDLVRIAQSSFDVINKDGNVIVITDGQEIEKVISEIAAAGINVFDKNALLLNVFKVNEVYYIQIRRLNEDPGDYIRVKYSGVTLANVIDYPLSLLTYKKLKSDPGIITIAPVETQIVAVVKLLNHFFSSDTLTIHGHEMFTDNYQVHATDKQAAYGIITDHVIDIIGDKKDMHLSIVHERLIIFAPLQDTSITRVVVDMIDVLPI